MKIEERIQSLPQRPYPAGFQTFAWCQPWHAEAEILDSTFYGKNLSDIGVRKLLTCIETPSLIAEAMVYFWPKILLTIYRHPDSRFAHRVYSRTIRLWNESLNRHTEPNRLEAMMNSHEKAATYVVLLSARNQITKKPRKLSLINFSSDLIIGSIFPTRLSKPTRRQKLLRKWRLRIFSRQA